MQYRREIDGLRSIAVLPVILFHSGLGLFSGGFVGVDIFFVISGYLITSILLTDLESGKFSILKFYERRIRRIIPALFVVVIATMPFSWTWMTPVQFSEYWKSIISIATFSSNIFFWMQSGYFDGSSELKPFLHTWSLAVEEQYYVIFPILLAVLYRWGRRWIVPLLLVMGLASLALSEIASYHQESANFFLTPTRAWELLAGALCAFQPRERSAKPAAATLIDQVLSGVGFILVIYAILKFDDQMRFPGLSGLVPVGGTALIILYARSGTLIAWLLSLPPLVGIGLISYSAYLWHQPLFAFARLQSLTEPPAWTMVILAVASLVLGWLSWRFVERPFRASPQSVVKTRKQVFLAGGASEAVLVGVSALVIAAAPLPYLARAHPTILIPDSMRAYEPQGAYAPCPGLDPADGKVACRRLGTGPKYVVIWGDSHANALSAGAYAVPGYSIFILGHWGCPPLVGVERIDTFGTSANCNSIGMTDVYAKYVVSLKPTTVFLMSRWTLFANGNYVHARLQRNSYFLSDGHARSADAAGSATTMIDAIGKTVDLLRSNGARVYLVQQVPDLHDYSPRGLMLLPDVPEAPIKDWSAAESRVLAAGARHGATIISTHDLFCAGGKCRLRNGDKPLYIDDSHLNYYGATPLFQRLVGKLD